MASLRKVFFMYDDITDVPGIRVGHDTDLDALTGCTVILCNPAAVGGVDVRGGAPGTRETDLLNPTCSVNEVHAVLLTGGSAFGLDAATGVMRILEKQGIGYNTGVAHVPIVPAAVLFDLAVGKPDVRPDAASGERAVLEATTGPIAQGSVGAGTGATINKLLGPLNMRKGGLGSASDTLPDGIIIGAIVAVNALGDVSGASVSAPIQANDNIIPTPGSNTTIAVVATTARLDKAQATKVAQMAHDGLARTITPVHTPLDGDTVFVLSLPSTDMPQADSMGVFQVGSMAADVLARSIVRGVTLAGNMDRNS
jgi:L-aminopeptidase/D-esterase-like protein